MRKLDKAFYGSLGAFCSTIFLLGFYMYAQGFLNLFEEPGGVLGTIIRVDKILSLCSGVGIIVTAFLKRHFQ